MKGNVTWDGFAAMPGFTKMFEDGQVTLYIHTPMSVEEYRTMGLMLSEWMIEQGLVGAIDNETTGEKILVPAMMEV